MKYVINENKINQYIYQYIDDMFDTEHINYFHPDDDYGEDPNRCAFYFNDYSDDETVFRWYDVDYWSDESYTGQDLRAHSPIVSVESPFHDRLNGLFGDMRKPIFIEWFRKNYPNYKIKSVGY